MRSLAALSSLGVIVAVAGCGADAAPGPVSPAQAPAESAAPSPGQTPTGVAKRLQGAWEIARYQSTRPIPKEAMPIMAELFESLRMRFEGSSVTVHAGKSTEERTLYEITEESGDAFRMIAKGGMFDGAQCRFLDADQWEVVDKGTAWPGTSLMKRTK